MMTVSAEKNFCQTQLYSFSVAKVTTFLSLAEYCYFNSEKELEGGVGGGGGYTQLTRMVISRQIKFRVATEPKFFSSLKKYFLYICHACPTQILQVLTEVSGCLASALNCKSHGLRFKSWTLQGEELGVFFPSSFHVSTCANLSVSSKPTLVQICQCLPSQHLCKSVSVSVSSKPTFV